MSFEDRIRKAYIMVDANVEEADFDFDNPDGDLNWIKPQAPLFRTSDGTLADIIIDSEHVNIGIGASADVIVCDFLKTVFEVIGVVSTAEYAFSKSHKALCVLQKFLDKYKLTPLSFSPDIAKAIVMDYLSIDSEHSRLFEITVLDACGGGFGGGQLANYYDRKLEGLLEDPVYIIKATEYSHIDELTVIAKHVFIVKNMRVFSHTQIPDNTWRNYIEGIRYPIELVIKDFSKE